MKKAAKNKRIKVFCISALAILLATTVLLISGCNNTNGQQGNENVEPHSDSGKVTIPEPVALPTEDPNAIIERGVTIEDVNQALAKMIYITENSILLSYVNEGLVDKSLLPNDVSFEFKSICGSNGSETIDLQHELNIYKNIFPCLNESTITMDNYPISLNYSTYRETVGGGIVRLDETLTIPVPIEIMQTYAKATGIQFDKNQISFSAITPEYIEECSDPEPLFRFLTSIGNMMESTEITNIAGNTPLEMR